MSQYRNIMPFMDLIESPPKNLLHFQMRTWQKEGAGGITLRGSRSEVSPPCLVRAEASKEVFFSLEKCDARKIRKAEKTFLPAGES